MTAPSFDFLTTEERALGERFHAGGHIIAPAEDREALDAIRRGENTAGASGDAA